MRARLSILGLYRFDSSIFDALSVPIGVDKDVVVGRILRTCAEYEILFPSADYMAFAIGQWSKERMDVWNRLFATTKYNYDPIANYDRHEQWSDSGSETSDGSSNSSESGSASAATNQSTAGFNTDEPKLHDVSDTRSAAGRSVEGEHTESGRSESAHEGRAWGNIGVTTTQQLIEQERSISEFNLVEFIADDFAREFCLLVY